MRSEAQVHNIEPLADQPDQARYQVSYHNPTRLFAKGNTQVWGRNVIVSAGVMGTLKLLFHCREVTKSLPERHSGNWQWAKQRPLRQLAGYQR